MKRVVVEISRVWTEVWESESRSMRVGVDVWESGSRGMKGVNMGWGSTCMRQTLGMVGGLKDESTLNVREVRNTEFKFIQNAWSNSRIPLHSHSAWMSIQYHRLYCLCQNAWRNRFTMSTSVLQWENMDYFPLKWASILSDSKCCAQCMCVYCKTLTHGKQPGED